MMVNSSHHLTFYTLLHKLSLNNGTREGGGEGVAVALSVVGVTPGQEVVGSIRAVAARSRKIVRRQSWDSSAR